MQVATICVLRNTMCSVSVLHERRVRRSCRVVDKAVWDPKRSFKVRVHTTAPVGPAAIAAAHHGLLSRSLCCRSPKLHLERQESGIIRQGERRPHVLHDAS